MFASFTFPSCTTARGLKGPHSTDDHTDHAPQERAAEEGCVGKQSSGGGGSRMQSLGSASESGPHPPDQIRPSVCAERWRRGPQCSKDKQVQGDVWT